jgi:hypothetical protein
MARRHNSPIVQFFFPPFKGPSVAVVDYHEAHDILTRRTKEFDRGTRSAQIFNTVLPNHHIAMKTTDHRFKGNKDLVKDLMTPSFLSQVSAPAIYDKILELVDLWELKAEVAQGRPFPAFEDISEATIDIILAVSFGFDHSRSITKRHVESLSAQPKIVPLDSTTPVELPRPALSPEIHALVVVNQSLHLSINSPLPGLHHWIMKKTKWRREFELKEDIITEQVDKSIKRLTAPDSASSDIKSALDHMILREVSAAQKAGKKPDFNRPSMRDEVGRTIRKPGCLANRLLAFGISHRWLGDVSVGSRMGCQVFSRSRRHSNQGPTSIAHSIS